METMQWLGLIALFAAVAKTAILFLSHSENELTSAFVVLCISMVLQNTFEFLVSLTFFSNPELTDLLLSSELISIIFLAFCLLTFALTVTNNRYIRPISLIFGLWGLACCTLLLTGQLVLGYERAGYSVVSIPGPYYAVLNAYAFCAFSGGLLALLHSSYVRRDEAAARSKQVLVAIAPLCLLIFIVQATRLLGINSTTAVSMPLATTFFVAMMVLYQSGRIVIFKIKWTVIWRLATSMRDVNLNEWVGLVEKLMVKEAMRITGNNQSEAAKLIKSNQSTVGRKFKKYEANGRGVAKQSEVDAQRDTAENRGA